VQLTDLALVLAVAVIALEGWAIYLLFLQHGRALLVYDVMRERLTAMEHTFARMTGQAAPQAPQGLTIGTLAPEFSLPDLDGQERNIEYFLGEKPLLLTFFSPQCGFCLQMAQQLGQLPEDGPNVLLVSRGDPEEHRGLAQEHGWRCGVVLEEGRDVAQAYGASGTPTGYLLDPKGRVASNLAVGGRRAHLPARNRAHCLQRRPQQQGHRGQG